jgi:hypothetical protein
MPFCCLLQQRTKARKIIVDSKICSGCSTKLLLLRGLSPLDCFDQGFNSFTEYVIRTPKKDVTDAAQGKKVFKGRHTHRLHFTMYTDEARFYKAVSDYIRDGYQILERMNDPMRRRATGFLLTTFQKLNASSTAAITSALSKRVDRLKGEMSDLAQNDEEDETRYDERYEGENEEQAVLKDDVEILQGEIDTLEALLGMKVKRDRKLDELLWLTEHIAQESPGEDKRKF